MNDIYILDFEKPLKEIDDKIQLLEATSSNTGINVEEQLKTLKDELIVKREEIYSNLNRWEIVQLARHPKRPHSSDFIKNITSYWLELHGDRLYADDPSILSGIALIENIKFIVIAQEKGKGTKDKVYRNFGGETPGYTKDIICLGPSSTSSFGRHYTQSTYDLHEYRNKIREGVFPISKSYVLSNDDIIRRDCNFELQCNQRLYTNKINKKYNINFSEYFSKEIKKLKELEKKGLLSYTDNLIAVTTVGRYFVRHICRVFDQFLDDNSVYKVHGN